MMKLHDGQTIQGPKARLRSRFFAWNKGKPLTDFKLGGNDEIYKLKILTVNSKNGLKVGQSRHKILELGG